jgi:hypothetical protein
VKESLPMRVSMVFPAAWAIAGDGAKRIGDCDPSAEAAAVKPDDVAVGRAGRFHHDMLDSTEAHFNPINHTRPRHGRRSVRKA